MNVVGNIHNNVSQLNNHLDMQQGIQFEGSSYELIPNFWVRLSIM